ncbi:hypothetical protein DEO72_LG3g2414 [Vigna unguiculata]|uniref:LRR receptor-like serine/threonine-protein kinase FLS2 n=1 Tax=Vigna unguiculata TaxID=3917 RepID=A0A4D6LH72_VIGUN|nr:hypothetical protein DEO72_LG3g2413 [Vigna unguiculata]QCD87874.1 hypothetical protein DEO72_LG3g2414 [Vigna unguiculata]
MKRNLKSILSSSTSSFSTSPDSASLGLSADIAHLPFLSNLSLANNKFSGPIPPALSSLSALRLLNLSNNGNL